MNTDKQKTLLSVFIRFICGSRELLEEFRTTFDGQN